MKTIKTILTLISLSFFLASPVWAGSVIIDLGGTPETITTTQYEAAVQRLTDEHNLRQRADNPMWIDITREEYIKQVFTGAFKSYLRQVAKRDAAIACAAYRGKNNAGKQAVKALLNGKSPCP